VEKSVNKFFELSEIEPVGFLLDKEPFIIVGYLGNCKYKSGLGPTIVKKILDLHNFPFSIRKNGQDHFPFKTEIFKAL